MNTVAMMDCMKVTSDCNLEKLVNIWGLLENMKDWSVNMMEMLDYNLVTSVSNLAMLGCSLDLLDCNLAR